MKNRQLVNYKITIVNSVGLSYDDRRYDLLSLILEKEEYVKRERPCMDHMLLIKLVKKYPVRIAVSNG